MKTSKKDFELFKKECEKWIEFYGLYEYQYTFENEKKDNDARADYLCGYAGQNCIINFNTTWNSKVTKEEVKKTAFHEITEILFTPLRKKAFYTFCEEDVEHDTHKIIRTLENSVFKHF